MDHHMTAALVPFADMMNHRFPNQTRFEYNPKRKGFEMHACENIDAGSEVFHCYGPTMFPVKMTNQ